MNGKVQFPLDISEWRFEFVLDPDDDAVVELSRLITIEGISLPMPDYIYRNRSNQKERFSRIQMAEKAIEFWNQYGPRNVGLYISEHAPTKDNMIALCNLAFRNGLGFEQDIIDTENTP